MIDPKLFTVEALLEVFLDPSIANIPWRTQAEIVTDYMPPYPHKDTRPACVVRMKARSGEDMFLRYSAGPLQGHFWDVYGDDYHTPALALRALLEAPYPPPAMSVTFKLPLRPTPTGGGA